MFINNHTTIPPLETAGHETYHARKGTSAREAYTDILRDHLNYASPAFREYQQIIADAYFEGDIDLEDGAQLQKFEEELFAYISGHLSDGSHEKMLRPMLRDYDAIRAAWERFRKDGADGLGAADAANSVGAAAAGFTGDTERGFSRNVATDQNMDPEIRESFQEDPEMDFRLGNQKTLAKAQAIFNAGFEGARSTLEQAIGQAQAGRKLPPEMVPLSRMVANQLARNGDVYGARKILSDISVELTEAGQLGQAAAILRGTDAATKVQTIEGLVKRMNEKFGSPKQQITVNDALIQKYTQARTDSWSALLNRNECPPIHRRGSSFQQIFSMNLEAHLPELPAGTTSKPPISTHGAAQRKPETFLKGWFTTHSIPLTSPESTWMLWSRSFSGSMTPPARACSHPERIRPSHPAARKKISQRKSTPATQRTLGRPGIGMHRTPCGAAPTAA